MPYFANNANSAPVPLPQLPQQQQPYFANNAPSAPAPLPQPHQHQRTPIAAHQKHQHNNSSKQKIPTQKLRKGKNESFKVFGKKRIQKVKFYVIIFGPRIPRARTILFSACGVKKKNEENILSRLLCVSKNRESYCFVYPRKKCEVYQEFYLFFVFIL